MKTVTIYTKEPGFEKKAWPLNIGTNYNFQQEGYGIIVIEDAMRVAGCIELGVFRDGMLTLLVSPGGLDIEFGKDSTRRDLNAMSVFIEPILTTRKGAKVKLFVPPMEGNLL